MNQSESTCEKNCKMPCICITTIVIIGFLIWLIITIA